MTQGNTLDIYPHRDSVSAMIQTCLNLPRLHHHFSSVVHLCPTLCDPMDCSMPSFSVHHQFTELLQTHVHRVGDVIQQSHHLSPPPPLPLLLLPSIFPRIRVFSNESPLRIGWPKYWSFSFSISLSNEYSD